MYRDPTDWPALVGQSRTPRVTTSTAALRVEIPLDLVQRLMEEGHICAADLRCLDHRSKQTLQQVCLDNCAHDLSAQASLAGVASRPAYARVGPGRGDRPLQPVPVAA